MALFGYLWLPDFPVWSAIHAEPTLQSQPVFVHRGGRVIAVSAVARQHGIARGWTRQRALSLVPGAVALPLDSSACGFAWEQVLSALYEITPRIEAVREGRAVFEIPTRRQGQVALARLMRDLGACGGAATNRTLAELAAYSAPAGILRYVRAGREASYVDKTPVETLCEAGVSSHTVERLRWFGWQRVGQLKVSSGRQVCKQFEDGALLWRFACAGAAPIAIAEKRNVLPHLPPPVIETRLAFEQAAREPGEWEAALDELLRRACSELNGRGAGSLSLAVETPHGRRAASRLLRESASGARSMQVPARAMLRDLLGRDELQALEVRLGSLDSGAKQGVLFETPDATSERHDAALREVLRRLEARHAGAVQKLQVRDPYSALPEERFALVPWLDAVSELEAASKSASLKQSVSSKQAVKGAASRRAAPTRTPTRTPTQSTKRSVR